MNNHVSFDSRCFYDGDTPVWLVSGALHYFRVPAGLWEDRIRKAKLAGLNCIETYIAWNVHEPVEGEFIFEGDYDVDRFFTLVEQAGMYIIARPGPYICAEWDNGGFPAWLTCKPGIKTREYDKTYLYYADRFFDELLPIITRHQISNGGRVILMQNENEYFYEGRPTGEDYLRHLNNKLRGSGIDVPIIACNGRKVPIPDTVETINTWQEVASQVEFMRKAQPETPKLLTEFWDGTFSQWGHPSEYGGHTPASVTRRCMESIGCSAMWNYYMWFGGTNFGYYGGQVFPNNGDLGAITTSYDYHAPLSEPGGMTDLYRATKTMNWMAQNLSPFLCGADPVKPSASCGGGFILQEMKSDMGSLIIIRTEVDAQEQKSVCLNLKDGKILPINITDYEAAVLPYGFRTEIDGKKCVIDYANGSILSLEPLIIFGHHDTEGVICVNAAETHFTYPEDDKPMTLSTSAGDIIVLSTEGAEHLWFLDDGSIVWQDLDFPIEQPVTPSMPPVFEGWTTYTDFSTMNGTAAWREIETPASMDELGCLLGYGWYRCRFTSVEETSTTLYFPEANDRLLVFLNGSYLCTWGKGSGAMSTPAPITFPKGANELVILADNMGRPNTGRKVGEKKGIGRSPGLDWQVVPNPHKTVEANGIPAEAQNQWELKTCWTNLESGFRSVIWDVDLGSEESLHLSISGLPEYAFVLVNGKLAFYHVALMSAYSDFGYEEFHLKEHLQPGMNHIELRMLGREDDSVPDGMTLYKYATNDVLRGDWSFTPFDVSQASLGITPSHPLRIHRSTFASNGGNVPLYITFDTMGKGHVYLNGRALGRYWNIGPHRRLYIPETWVEDTNEVVIFEEEGRLPDRIVLEY
ncbi:MAG: beta-galactosidase [Armatimonadota bacterium]